MSLALLRLLAFCLIFVLLISEVGPRKIGYNRNKGNKKTGRLLSTYNIPDLSETNPTDLKAVLKFVKAVDKQTVALAREATLASFVYTTNLTEYNKEIKDEKEDNWSDLDEEVESKMKSFDWRQIKKQNASLYRWFKLFHLSLADATNSRYEKYLSRSWKEKSMAQIFNDARICPYRSRKKSKCTLAFDPGVKNIMAKSRNPKELKHIWKEVRDKTGKKMRNAFIEHIETENSYAKETGYSDTGETFRAAYECKPFAKDMAKIVREVQPLYKHFHAYVRRKLIKYYKLDIPDDSPIPAHLTGNLYAQDWSNIYNIVNPYPKKGIPNVTEILIKNNMEPLDLIVIAEQFFLSIGLERMTPYFWAGSLFVKPNDREVVCHAAAMDLSNRKDFRIRMCTQVNSNSLTTAHHEMGHIEYYMLYKDLLHVFRESANPGFHEAVGEVITLSSMTPNYLKSLKLMDKDIVEDEGNVDDLARQLEQIWQEILQETTRELYHSMPRRVAACIQVIEFEISYLVKVALQYLPTVPYDYIIDLYRYGVYNGSIPIEKLNSYWWKYRLKYQGVCPPVERTEKDFDAGAKYHVANIIEYMRYFFANILMFQMHKSMCKEVGHKGPLHKCNIYGKKKAGDLLRKVLSLGKSVHWTKVMSILTNNETSRLQSGSLLEYFSPLLNWLKKENENETVGWNSEDPMICP